MRKKLLIELEHRGVSGCIHGFNHESNNRQDPGNRSQYIHIELFGHIPNKTFCYEISFQPEGGHAKTMYRNSRDCRMNPEGALDSLIAEIKEIGLNPMRRDGMPFFVLFPRESQKAHFVDYYTKSMGTR